MFFHYRIVCVLIVFSLASRIRCQEVQEIDEARATYRYLSELQSEYFAKLPKWWLTVSEIDGGHASDDFIQAVVNEHREYIFKPSREQLKLNYYRTYLLLDIGNFNDTISVLYNTLKEDSDFLYDENVPDDNRFDGTQLTTWARSEKTAKLKDNLQLLFDISLEPDVVFKHIQKEAKCCERYVQYVVSENQLVREYYGNVGVFLLRGYAMLQLSYILLTVAGHGSMQQESLNFHDTFQQRYTNFRDFINDMLGEANRDLWKCDPNPYLNKNDYYTAVTNFMQGYLDNEINLNSEQTCSNTCEDYRDGKHFGCHADTLCAHENFKNKTCSGRVLNCVTLDEDLTACSLNEGSERRRYNFLKLKNGTTWGHDVMCLNAEKKSIGSWTDWFYKCSTCLCYCDEPGDNSDRYFSLREVVSDIQANKVITGVALQKRNRVIQFVIAERELQPEAEVDNVRYGPNQWLASKFDFLNASDSQEAIDYHTLTWQHRSINLDTVVLPAHQVMTGVRFILLDGRLAVQIRATDIDFVSGKLIKLEQSEWINHVNSGERTKIEIRGGDVPTRSQNVHHPVDSVNRFVEFQPTSMQKDIAQVTVPYIESVLLEASDPQPLSGLGLYYKDDAEHSGFIAVKLIAYELQPSIGAPAPHAVYHLKQNASDTNALPTNLNLNSGDLKAQPAKP